MSEYLHIYILLTVCFAVVSSQKAILLSSSLGYYNYRQVSNIVKLYHNLRHNGFADEDILLMIGEMQPCCEKNHLFASLSFYDGDYTNIFRNIEVDYSQSQLTSSSVSNILMGFYDRSTLNKQKLQLQENEPLFIYVSGHGGDKYLKIRERQAITDQQFATIFNALISKNTTNKNAIMSDSCGAITPFEKVEIGNFLAMGSSSLQEKSLSHGFDYQLNQPKTDDFSFYFDEVLNEKAVMKGKPNFDAWTFNDLLKYMDKSKLKVNSKVIAKGVSKQEKVSSFVKRRNPQQQFKKYKFDNDSHLLQQFFNS